MRILLVLVLAACESPPAKSYADLAVAHDLAVAVEAGPITFDCSQLHQCVADCQTASLVHQCAVGCESTASDAAKTAYQQFLNCVAAACTTDAGRACSAGEAALIEDPTADLSMISDACGTCIDATAASGGSCNALANACFGL